MAPVLYTAASMHSQLPLLPHDILIISTVDERIHMSVGATAEEATAFAPLAKEDVRRLRNKQVFRRFASL